MMLKSGNIDLLDQHKTYTYFPQELDSATGPTVVNSTFTFWNAVKDLKKYYK